MRKRIGEKCRGGAAAGHTHRQFLALLDSGNHRREVHRRRQGARRACAAAAATATSGNLGARLCL